MVMRGGSPGRWLALLDQDWPSQVKVVVSIGVVPSSAWCSLAMWRPSGSYRYRQ
jgi:hypothetical protein